MDEPVWLTEAIVRAIHQRQLAEHGGLGGVREPGGLASALARPQQLFAYGDPPPDFAALAACYAGAFVRNHPFVDGNKRVAHVAARMFLRLNGWDLVAPPEEKYVAIVGLVTHELSEEEFATWIRSHLAPRGPRPGERER
jgi:death-on-curing protein